MRISVYFIIEGLPSLREVTDDQEFADLLAERVCIQSSEHHLSPSESSHETIVKILYLVSLRRTYDLAPMEFLRNAPLSAATFDQYWTLSRAEDLLPVSSMVKELQASDLDEMELNGDDEAEDWFRHEFFYRDR